MPKLSAALRNSLSVTILVVVLLLALTSWAAVEAVKYNYDPTYQLKDVIYKDDRNVTHYSYDYAGNRDQSDTVLDDNAPPASEVTVSACVCLI